MFGKKERSCCIKWLFYYGELINLSSNTVLSNLLFPRLTPSGYVNELVFLYT